MRILLSEGSGLTSRQVAGRLSELGHEVEVLSSTPFCLTRFTRHVRAVHAVPSFGEDPFGWLEAAERIAGERKIQLLFPTQEQVAILSACQAKLGVRTIVPPFGSLARVQDKISAFRSLREMGVPQPRTAILRNKEDVELVEGYPAFIKRPISTASSGVRRVRARDELMEAAHAMGLGAEKLIVQSEARGALAMVQAVSDNGRLIAHHANLRIREGVGGGASLKESVIIPGLRDLLAGLVAALRWRGGISLDVILTEVGPLVIDVNPRLVEPGNALRAGVDLVGAMLSLATSSKAPEQHASRQGVMTHQGLIAILGAAAQVGTRRGILAKARDTIFARGEYSGSAEELTPVSDDIFSAVPVAAALLSTLVHPPLWKRFYNGAVGPYALTPEAWRQIVTEAPGCANGA